MSTILLSFSRERAQCVAYVYCFMYVVTTCISISVRTTTRQSFLLLHSHSITHTIAMLSANIALTGSAFGETPYK